MSNTSSKKENNSSIMITIASQLEKIMEKRSVDVRDLVNATGISTSSINMIRRGEGNTTITNLWKISQFFSLPISYFIETEQSDSQKDEMVKHIKVYDINCKRFTEGKELYILPIKKEYYPNASFAVKINDESMHPLFNKGTVFIISEDVHPQNGDTVLLSTNNKNIIRKIALFSKKCFFYTLDIKAEFEELNSFDILGIVSGLLSNNK